MGEVERYPGGTFCWVDLGTDDAPGAKAFYGGLFGWEFDDLPTGDKGIVHQGRGRRRGRQAGAGARRRGAGGAVRRAGGRPGGHRP
jgi:predicted enzyme related to lactoylglutathione lyase